MRARTNLTVRMVMIMTVMALGSLSCVSSTKSATNSEAALGVSMIEAAQPQSVPDDAAGMQASRRLSQAEAVEAAEHFVLDNGYTKAPPQGRPRMRHKYFLQSKAWGYRLEDDDWMIIFRPAPRSEPRVLYHLGPDGATEIDPSYSENNWGSVVFVAADGQKVFMYHLDGRLSAFNPLHSHDH